MEYIEQNCVIEHQGRRYESGGAFVNPAFITAYLGKNGQLADWHGNVIGSYRITSTWATPRSFVSSTMHQVYAVVDGVRYTGRSAGLGMSFNGKRASRQFTNGGR